MVTSIVLTGCHKIGLNSNKKMKVNGVLLSTEKEVPFVRYRFKEYTQTEYDYIKEMQKKFSKSTHLAEVGISEHTVETMQYLEDNFPNLAKYLYIEITNEDVDAGTLSDDILDIIEDTSDINIDRFILKDNTTNLDFIAAKKLIDSMNDILDIDDDYFGICSSPLSFEDRACLTAVKARELMSDYGCGEDMALPSANHQCMECCGCIRHMIIDSDLAAPLDAKVKGQKKAQDTSEKQKKKESEDGDKPKAKSKVKNKKVVRVGQFSL